MKIVTDCAADLTPDEINEYGVEVAPLYINFPGEQVDASEITADDFYARLKGMFPKIPTTAQPGPGIFSRIYHKLADVGEEVLSIHISSGLSGTLESARNGAAQLPGSLIHLVDTLTLSGGERFQVLAAAVAAKHGKNKEYILDRLAKIQEAAEVVYTLETLEYLQRGGRIGRVQALAGALLGIKPIIHVDKADGKYSTLGKERTMTRALAAMAEHLGKKFGSSTPVWISVLHGQFEEQAQQLAAMLRERMTVGKLEILRISPVLGVHTGPGIVGAAVVPIALMEE